MIIGIPKEIKTLEKRVALLPQACAALVAAGHKVLLEAGAGQGAGFEDAAYTACGVTLVANAPSLYEQAQMVVKVKEPQPEEWALLRRDHLLFCYLHLAAEVALAEALQNIGLTAVAFETVSNDDGTTPLLAPMSAVAGRLAVQLGAWLLHIPQGGKGQLLGGIQAHSSGHVCVIGAGVAGREAAHLAYQMGAKVTLMDINPNRLAEMQAKYPAMVCTLCTAEGVAATLPTVDLLVGAVYVVGKRAPHVVTEDHVKTMQKGSVVVDISIDQGGCIATSRPCTHAAPFYVSHGVVHSAITNLPGAVPLASSQVLSDAILPYVGELAKQGTQSERWSPALVKGLNVKAGQFFV